MTKGTESIKTTNLVFYENAYNSRHFLKVFLKQFISYDQLSKTRRNLRIVRNTPLFSKNISILDYGFGHGTLLLKMPGRHQIYGCELSTEAIKNVKKLCSLLRRKVYLYSSDEFVAASHDMKLDLVCCSHVIEHVDDDHSLLKLFHVALGADGHLLLNVPINEVWNDPKHVRQYSAESTKLLLECSGFKVENIIEADRWTAFILYHEYVSTTNYKFLLKVLRLFLALLPIVVLDAFEKFLPEKYPYQQLLVLAKKV